MVFLLFLLVSILTITALAIERVLKDVRDQNKEILELLKKNSSGQI